MGKFEEYIDNLKKEAERGSTLNDKVAVSNFVRVADNVEARISDLAPEENSKKELYQLSQQFMLMTRYVHLFTNVIWRHPEAKACTDVPRCREKAIKFLHQLPVLRDRMHAVWKKGEWSTNGSTSPTSKLSTATSSRPETVPHNIPVNPSPLPSKLPSLTSVFPTTLLPADTRKPATPALSRSPSPDRILLPSPKRQCSPPQNCVILPFDLPSTFQELARANTARSIETCGVLLGYQQGNSTILVTTVVVPKQTGTRDTCETLPGAEELILSYALSNDLVCLGWIHTHPTQSCFLSSVDMHTSLSYQQMLPNAIAIVVAPTDHALPVGVWRLTQTGLENIRKCPLRGFHDHEKKDGFTEIVKEISWDPTFSVVVVDNRR